MAFLENLGKRVGEAAQAAAKKSGELVETTKLSVNINSEEDKIQKLYTQIGKILHEKYTAGGAVPEETIESFEAIKIHEQNIKALRDKVVELKGMKLCVSCGAEIEKNQLFCSKCGARNEIPAQPVAAQAEAATATTISCPACGSVLQQGAAFCTNCGTKIG